MSVTEALLGPMLAAGAPKPLITYYDDASGARVELSRLTTANWAAKTANWLVEEIDLEPGAPVSVALPAHWQTVGVLLGAWWCGAHVTADPRGAEVAFVPAAEPGSGEGAHTVAAVGLDAMGAPVRGLPGGVTDYVSDIRVHGDDFQPLSPISGKTPALLDRSVDELVAAARERAASLAIGRDARVMSTLDWTLRDEQPGGVLDGLLAVLAGQASLVQVGNPDPQRQQRRREAERITIELGG